MTGPWSRFMEWLGAGSNIPGSLLETPERTRHNGSRDKKNQRALATADDKDSPNPDEEGVDVIVVDNNFLFDDGTRSIIQPSNHGGTPAQGEASATHGAPATDHDDAHSHRNAAVSLSFLNALRFRVWSSLNQFFFTEVSAGAPESQYAKHYQMKWLSLAGSLVMLFNWVLIYILIPRESQVLSENVFYRVICPCLVVPLPVIIIFDLPKNHPRVYQWFMSLAVWSWSAYALLQLQICGLYSRTEMMADCRSKDFLDILFYTSAYPVIALFALGQNRLMAAFTALLNAVLIASVIRFERTWTRNLLNYLLYTIVILWAHYKLEVAERELNILRDRLKVQARAAQKAQARERVAADSRKRLYGHISREVRVLLSTALLAVQNMQVAGLFAPDNIEFTALEASLNGMSKILYDMLDFNRIEAGRFELVSKPYAFHKVIKGALTPLQMAAQARGQELITELDPQIDVKARTAFYRAKSMSEERIAQLLQENDEDAALILGDEHRLKQLMTNLGSNACKFTPSGGKITIRTKILPRFGALDDGTTTGGDESPTPVKPSRDANHDGRSPLGNDNGFQGANPHSSTDTETPSLTDERLTAFERRGRSCEDQMVVRIEVEDTGVGIRRQDIIDNELFSPYFQPDWGRFHSCGGTGFGLALSKEIVSLSGGRLGVKSKIGHGSMFWVELAAGIGQKILANSDFQQHRPASGSSAAEHRPSLPFSPPLNVLVVDDDALTRKLMGRILTRNGCVVETVDNGKSALDMFTCDSPSPSTDVKPDENAVNTMGSKYDVIFLDKEMPLMSGMDTIKQLREMKRKDFVVGVTGNALKNDQEYLEAGVDVVLTKPVMEADLKKCLFSANERRKQADAEGQRRTPDAPSDPSQSGPS